MHLPDFLSLHTFDNHPNRHVMNGGLYLWLDKKISEGEWQEGVWKGEIEGRSSEFYGVEIELLGDEIVHTDCTCPAERQPWCKHIAGSLLHIRTQKHSILAPLDDFFRRRVKNCLPKNFHPRKPMSTHDTGFYAGRLYREFASIEFLLKDGRPKVVATAILVILEETMQLPPMADTHGEVASEIRGFLSTLKAAMSEIEEMDFRLACANRLSRQLGVAQKRFPGIHAYMQPLIPLFEKPKTKHYLR